MLKVIMDIKVKQIPLHHNKLRCETDNALQLPDYNTNSVNLYQKGR